MDTLGIDESAIATVLIPQLEQEIKQDPKVVGNISGVFQINVTKKGKPLGTWHMIFQGQKALPIISSGTSKQKPDINLTIDDEDFLKLVLGELNGIQAFLKGKLKVQGDYLLAQKLEMIFKQAKGPEKAKALLSKIQPKAKL